LGELFLGRPTPAQILAGVRDALSAGASKLFGASVFFAAEHTTGGARTVVLDT